MLRPSLTLALLCAIAAPSAAQAPRSIDPGMSEAKVVERLGEPDATRAAGDFKYLFYRNGCIRQCGMDDVVILQKDSVVDAMFRSADRSYSGKSSSPRAIPADVAARTRPGAREVPSGEVVQAGAARDTAPSKAAAGDTAQAPAIGGERERGAVQAHLAAARIELDAARFQNARGRRLVAELQLDAGDQLAHEERLHHVVVGAELEAHDAVRF